MGDNINEGEGGKEIARFNRETIEGEIRDRVCRIIEEVVEAEIEEALGANRETDMPTAICQQTSASSSRL